MSANAQLIEAVRRALAERADPAKAPQMQAYMKSEMPYRGVQSPGQRQVAKQVFAEHPLICREDWADTILALWRGAAFREERYLAIGLASDPRYAEHRTRAALPLFEELIVDGAWWDLVDPVAIRLFGGLLEADTSRAMERVALEWSRDESMWKRRSSIICQVGRKEKADLELLYACIEPNLADREFFVRKAIGWALRDQAWVRPGAIVHYAEAMGDRLSPLSRREALKNIPAG